MIYIRSANRLHNNAVLLHKTVSKITNYALIHKKFVCINFFL